ncbi:hypothetical protein ACFH04_01490 [Streptomyces noboritoensis]|uniref:Uncharacterized protein n=1 Tax=Streptomyces noboritoensis TaxID=67337 RepID=A0ABV6T9F5_9ACTN
MRQHCAAAMPIGSGTSAADVADTGTVEKALVGQGFKNDRCRARPVPVRGLS